MSAIEARLSRRDLVKSGFAAAIGISLTGFRGGAMPPVQRRPATKPIPSTGEAVPVIGLGTGSSFSGAAGEPSEHDRLRETLRRFSGLGGTVVDTAPNYGRAEAVLGTLLNELSLRESIFFASKVADVHDRQAGAAQARETAERAGPAPIDLLQVHNLVSWRAQLPLLFDLKAEGVTRYVGVTTYRDEQYDEVETILRGHPVDFVQVDYSIDNRGVEERVLPLARDRGVAVITNMPFGAGRLFGSVRNRPTPAFLGEYGATTWAQFFLRWIVSHESVTASIPATANPEHVEDNVRAAYPPLPSQARRDEMAARFTRWLDV